MSYSNSTEFATSSETGTGYISGVTFGPKKVKFAIVDGMAVFEGDIVLGTVEELHAFSNDVEKGVVITARRFRWPSGLVPFEIDPNLLNQQRVTDAIAHWESRTTIRFIRRTNEPNYVFFEDRRVCSSAVGMQGGRQSISVGAGCDWGRVAHEIGHAVGLFHEQSREKRDKFVRIHLDRVIPTDAARSNFDQHITDGDDIGEYDYCSIMHYPADAFCITPCPGPTIEVLQPTLPCGTTIGQRNGLSNGDVAAVNHIYGDRLLPRYRQTPFTINNIIDVSGFYDPDTNSVTRIIGGRDGVYRNNSLLPVNFSGGSIVSVSGYYSFDDRRHIAIVGTTGSNIVDIWWKRGQAGIEGHGVLPVDFANGTIISVSGFFSRDEQRHVVIVGKANGTVHNIWWKSGMDGIEGHAVLPVGFNAGTIVSVSGYFNGQDRRHYVIVGTTNGTIHKITWKIGENEIEQPLPVRFGAGSIVSVSGYYSDYNQANNVTVGISDGIVGRLFDIYWKSDQSEVSGPYALTPFPTNIVGLGALYNAGTIHPHVIFAVTAGGVHDLF